MIENNVKGCSNCGWIVPSTSVSSELHCSICGTILKIGSIFCGNCGHKATVKKEINNFQSKRIDLNGLSCDLLYKDNFF
jgi:DNA-directed RNA polymerase subunit RPC12/RpoP